MKTAVKTIQDDLYKEGKKQKLYRPNFKFSRFHKQTEMFCFASAERSARLSENRVFVMASLVIENNFREKYLTAL